MSRAERIKEFKENYDVTEIELIACDFYYKKTMHLRKNLVHEWGSENFYKEKELLKDMLKVRCFKLNKNFTWNENYKKQLLELKNKVMIGFSRAYEEAKEQFRILKERLNRNDSFINGFNIDIKLKPFILEFDINESCMCERYGIYYILYNMLPDTLWTEDTYYEQNNLDDLRPKRYENNDINYNIFFGKESFSDSYICGAMYDLYTNCINILSWHDILKINEIWVEVMVTHQHFIENIGKDAFLESNK